MRIRPLSLKSIFAATFLLVAVAACVWGQDGAAISGRVVDPDGRRHPGATVTVKNWKRAPRAPPRPTMRELQMVGATRWTAGSARRKDRIQVRRPHGNQPGRGAGGGGQSAPGGRRTGPGWSP